MHKRRLLHIATLAALPALVAPGPAHALNAPVDQALILDAEDGGDPRDAIDFAGDIADMTPFVWNLDSGDPAADAHHGTDLGSMFRYFLKGHGVVTVQAIELLGADGFAGAFAMFDDPVNFQSLLDGLREEDYGGNVDTIPHSGLDDELGIRFDSHSHSHFYDVTRDSGTAALIGRGLRITDGIGGAALQHLCDPDPGESFIADTLPSLLMTFGIVDPVAANITQGLQELAQDWTYCTLVGPQIDAATLTDIHYARAVDAMRKGDQRKAMRHLGRALHLVQDLAAVPYHSANLPGTADAHHRPYEYAVDRLLADGTIAHADTAEPFYRSGVTTFHTRSVDQLGAGWLPSDYARHGAIASAKLVDTVTESDDDHDRATAEALIPLAEQLSAGLLRRFHDNWKYEDFAVTVLSVDKVKDVHDDADFSSPADLFARVATTTWNHAFAQYEVVGRTFMYLQGTQIGRPNFPNRFQDDPDDPHAYSPTTWQVAKWHYRQNYEAAFKLEVFDDDGDWPAEGERLDASPDPGSPNLWLRYAADGTVFDTNETFLETGTPDRTQFCLAGDADEVAAQVCLTLERIPGVGPSTEQDSPEIEVPPVPDAYLCVPTDPAHRDAYFKILFGEWIDGYGLEPGLVQFTGEKVAEGQIWLWFGNQFIVVDCDEMSAAQFRQKWMFGDLPPMGTTMPGTEFLGELWSVNADAFPLRWSPPVPEPLPELHPEFWIR